jgi:hypothetical protein
MADETKYKVWGYWAKNGMDTHHNRKLIDSAETTEEAHQIRKALKRSTGPSSASQGTAVSLSPPYGPDGNTLCKAA